MSEGQHKMKSDQHRWTEAVEVLVRVLLRNRREVCVRRRFLSSSSIPVRLGDQKGLCSGEFVRLDLIIGFCGCFKA